VIDKLRLSLKLKKKLNSKLLLPTRESSELKCKLRLQRLDKISKLPDWLKRRLLMPLPKKLDSLLQNLQKKRKSKEPPPN